ncbi:MAG TPA: hypothetical protein VF189_05965 [Patescibacteria group bacterium]
MTHEDGKDQNLDDPRIPDVSAERLIELGIRDLPTNYLRVKEIKNNKPIFEVGSVDTSTDALSKLSRFERAMLEITLDTRKTFSTDYEIHLVAGGLGHPEKSVSRADLAIIMRLNPHLYPDESKRYDVLTTGNPHDYLNSYLSKPQVGDIVLPSRSYTGNYSSTPRQFSLSEMKPDVFDNPTSPEAFRTRITVFRAKEITPVK